MIYGTGSYIKQLGVTAFNSPSSTSLLLVHTSDECNHKQLDFLTLDAITIFDKEPVEDPKRILSILNGSSSTYFTKVNFSNEYGQVSIDEESKQCSAFPTNFCLFQFSVLPFGLVNIPAIFNHLMHLVLGGLPVFHPFLDIILLSNK